MWVVLFAPLPGTIVWAVVLAVPPLAVPPVLPLTVATVGVPIHHLGHHRNCHTAVPGGLRSLGRTGSTSSSQTKVAGQACRPSTLHFPQLQGCSLLQPVPGQSLPPSLPPQVLAAPACAVLRGVLLCCAHHSVQALTDAWRSPHPVPPLYQYTVPVYSDSVRLQAALPLYDHYTIPPLYTTLYRLYHH